MIKNFVIFGALAALSTAFPQLRNSYGLPVQTQFDTPQVIIPSTSYGSPIAPSPTYGIPTNYPVPIAQIPIRNSYSFTIPRQEPAPAPVYGPPVVNDVPAVPAPTYGIPVVNDVPAPELPAQVYGPPITPAPAPPAPVVVYGPPPTPPQVYGPPPTLAPVYGPPASDVYVPAPVYGPPAQTYGPPADQVRAPAPPQTIFTWVNPQVFPVPVSVPTTNGLLPSSAGTPPATVGVHSATSGAVGTVFVPDSVVAIPGVIQTQPPPPPQAQQALPPSATFISGPAMKSNNTVFCI